MTFLANPALPQIQQAMLQGKPIPEGFYSTTSMKLDLQGMVITSMTMSDDSDGGKIISMSINFTSMEMQPVR